MAMWRHLVERSDFDVFVATDGEIHPSIAPSLRLTRSPALQRMAKTRFSRLMRQFEMALEPRRISQSLRNAVADFKPDAIFTIPDNTLSWTAARLARELRLPLITNFQDWWPKGQFTYDLERPYPWVSRWIEHRFRRMYRQSAVAFCTSEGMRDALGPHPCAPVLYPCPARRDSDFTPSFDALASPRPLRVIYAGTMVNEYGRQILRLARATAGLPSLRLELYGPQPDWPAHELAWAKSCDVYRGLLPFAELKKRLREADVGLVVMSFSRELEMMMRTSFTTKFLDYTQTGKPVLVWGPSYAQPVRVVKETGSGAAVERDDLPAVIQALERLRERSVWEPAARASWALAHTLFDADSIHRVFTEAIDAKVRRCPAPAQ